MSSIPLPFDLPEPPPPNPVTGGKLDRELALSMAQRYLHLLEPVCSRIEIAGSIRRHKPLVHDIEIVVLEKFPGACFQVLSDYRAQSQIAPLDFWVRKGPKYLHFRDRRSYSPPALAGGQKGGLLSVPVDLFLSQESYWGWTFFIRTGSQEWNLACMQRLHSLGYNMKDNRIFSPPVYGGTKGGSPSTDGGTKGGSFYSTREESDIFELLGIPFVEPHLRTDIHALNRALYAVRQS